MPRVSVTFRSGVCVADASLPTEWTSRTLTSLRRALLRWFDQNRRSLPWRVDRDPYRVWVSEVMLQQTTVAAVVPYFERFMVAFPNVVALAAADEQAVLKLWQGLGYYRRARHLHQAARELVATHGGELPDDPGLWAALPGVGRYIFGAVLSQAFDRKLPIVEANTLRVLSRLFGFRGDPRVGAGNKWAWAAASRVLPDRRVGDFNQAMMELGALICTPAAPRCGMCPVARWCETNRLGLQESIPPRQQPKATVEVREVGIVVCDGGRVLLCRRPPSASRWPDMWEVPHAERHDGESDAVAVERITTEMTELRVKPGTEVQTVRHRLTRFAIRMTCWEATRVSGTFRSQFYTDAVWAPPGELTQYPVGTPQRKLIDALIYRRRSV